MRDAGQAGVAKRGFIASWIGLCVAKLALAWRLPLFVDEAFYWQEGRHPAWAYSDLPALTAWLAHLGDALAPAQAIGLRLPFLAMGAAVPWLVVAMTRREFGATAGWQAGLLALLLPLAGTMGLLALPDVPLLLASALCLDAGLRLLRRVDAFAAGELALGLVIGGLTHYRFVAVIAVGFVALLALREGRAALRDWRTWLAVLVGALAWLPLLLWNLDHADAGVRFQLVDRHPWSFSGEGLWLGVVQLLLVTPLLLAAMVVAVRRAFAGSQPAPRYLALTGVMIVFGFFALGFFADRERVSFHWPLPGHLALLPLVPVVIAGWPRGWRNATHGLALLGLLGALGYYAMALVPARALGVLGEERPVHFAGWRELSGAVQRQLQEMPAGAGVVAGNFRIGAQLGHLRNDADIPVLVHPLNDKHGRAVQLASWGLLKERVDERPVLLVVAATDVKFREQLAYFQSLCERVGPLPVPRELSVDGGRQRFLLFPLLAPRAAATTCVTPALAHVDVPADGSEVERRFDLSAWAVKDQVGVRRLEVLLEGQVVATAQRAGPNPWVLQEFLQGRSRDPAQPDVQFDATVDASRFPAGPHRLGLRVFGGDGAIETSRERVIVLR